MKVSTTFFYSKRNKNPSRRKPSFIQDIAKNKYSYLIVLPAFLYILIFKYLTYPYLVIAFQKFNYRNKLWQNEWIGFKKFEFFFKSIFAWQVTWNTIKLNFLFIVFATFFSILLALLLNELKTTYYLKVCQSTMIFPNFISWVVVSYVLLSLLSTDSGIINRFLSSIGLEPVKWYMDPNPWPWILVLVRIWKGAGLSAVIYLAVISGIDPALFASAQIDGASRLQIIWYITIPLIMRMVMVMLLFSLGGIMYGDFGMIYALVGDNGMLYKTVDVIDTYVFRTLRDTGDPSQGTAIGLYQSTIGFIMVYTTNRIVKKYYREGAIY